MMRNLSHRISLLTFGIILSLSVPAFATTVAIIDSGVDYRHVDLRDNIWMNPGEVPWNDRDDDGNGFIDDVYGWNFAENNNEVIDYSYLGMLSPDIRRFFDIQTGMMLGTATREEIEWVREKINDQEFLRKLMIYGNFMHGTHVAGIAVEGVEEAKILTVKLIPTEVKLPFSVQALLGSKDIQSEDKSLRMGLVKMGLAALAKQQAQLLIQIGEYVGNHGSRVANGSFGTGYAQAEMIVSIIFQGIFGRGPSEEETFEVATHFLNALIEESTAMVDVAPETLFVFAAGNDNTNNDVFPTSPTNIARSNVISVAATYDRVFLAPFSNYGVNTVDVAAPGLGIVNTVPGDEYLGVSGTSQAAPYVARVAAEVISVNPELTPSEVRRIILGTVDAKDFLEGKVRSGGIANGERAKFAAELSKTMALNLAIRESLRQVADVPADMDKAFMGFLNFIPGLVPSLPSPFVVK